VKVEKKQVRMLKSLSKNMKIIFWPKSDFFVNFRNLVFFIDDCYELSYEQSVAQLVSADALGALFD